MVKNKEKNKKSNKSSENEFPPGMAPKMLNMMQTIEELGKVFDPLLSKSYHEVFSKLTPLEKSKIGMMESYTINSLFWVMMKISKDKVDDILQDDFKIEMGRLKELQSRIAEVEIRGQRPQVNADVASRLIRRGIGDTDGSKKKKMRVEEKPDNCESNAFKASWR